MRYENRGEFYHDIGEGTVTPEEAVRRVVDFLSAPTNREEQGTTTGKILYDRFVREARESASGDILVDGGLSGIKYSYAKCCNPIPGDQVVGFIRTGKGVSIHRSSCPNAIRMLEREATASKSLDVAWGEKKNHEFIAAIRVSGEDRPGMLNDITHAIVSYRNTNIRSVNIESEDSTFVGIVTVMVRHTEHLERLTERLLRIPNIDHVERFDHPGEIGDD